MLIMASKVPILAFDYQYDPSAGGAYEAIALLFSLAQETFVTAPDFNFCAPMLVTTQKGSHLAPNTRHTRRT